MRLQALQDAFVVSSFLCSFFSSFCQNRFGPVRFFQFYSRGRWPREVEGRAGLTPSRGYRSFFWGAGRQVGRVASENIAKTSHAHSAVHRHGVPAARQCSMKRILFRWRKKTRCSVHALAGTNAPSKKVSWPCDPRRATLRKCCLGEIAGGFPSPANCPAPLREFLLVESIGARAAPQLCRW